MLYRLRHDTLYFGSVTDVGLIEPGDAAFLRYGVGHRLSVPRASSCDNDFGAGFGECAGDALANALPRARDDGNFSREIDYHDLFLVIEFHAAVVRDSQPIRGIKGKYGSFANNIH
jgi:hypothetical protein